MNRIIKLVFGAVIVFGMCLLMIPALGITIGLTKKHIIEPMHQRYFVPPLYVDDPRCCR